MERHDLDHVAEKWSIRKMGVWHRRSQSNNSYIVINPSEALLKKFDTISDLKEEPTPLEMHSVILSTAMENWRWYISDIEGRCLQMASATLI